MNLLFINQVRRYRWYLLGRYKIRKQIERASARSKLKVVLGAGTDIYDGWISTDLPHFNVLKEEDWKYFFGDYRVDNLLIEHVLEHLTYEEVSQFLFFSHKYLKPQGCLRIAVPDGYHPDPEYIKFIAPPYHGHQTLWNVDAFKALLAEIGFNTELLEYFTEEGKFVNRHFDFTNGSINRSRTHGFRFKDELQYSSLILDAYKL